MTEPYHDSDIVVPEEKQYSYLNLGPTHPATHGIFPNAISNAEGEFWISTYDAEDGAPLGEYAVTAKWPIGEGLMVHSESPDRLKGRYADPTKSTTKITVKEATRAKPNEIPPLAIAAKQ